MDELDILLQEKSNLKNKINGAMKELKVWFESKIEHVRDFFRKVSRRIKESLKRIKNDDKLTRDIKRNGEIVFEKGTLGSSYKNGVLTHLSELGVQSNIVIKDSKKGISYIANDDADRAMYIKRRVMDTLKKVATIGGIILSLEGIHLAMEKNRENKNRKDTVNSHFEKLGKNKNRTVYDVEFEPKDNVRSHIFDDEDEGGGTSSGFALSLY